MGWYCSSSQHRCFPNVDENLFRCDKTQVNTLYPFQTAYLGQNISSFFPVLFRASGGFMKSEVRWDSDHRPNGFHIKVKPLVYINVS